MYLDARGYNYQLTYVCNELDMCIFKCQQGHRLV